MLGLVLAYIFLIWYAIMVVAALCGFYSIFTRFAAPPVPPAPVKLVVSQEPSELDLESEYLHEPVTIIRPVKGVDPELETCLELAFCQAYPSSKIEVLFCVADAHDEAMPVLRALLKKYPHIDSQILVLPPEGDYYGPNPKVNNLAKGFRAAKYDLLWIMDLNVWASRHVMANSVRAMATNANCGMLLSGSGRQVKLVHHVPLALAVDQLPGRNSGSLLDEMFLFTSHLKFYVSLNNLCIAPCVNGKSNIYRRLALATAVSLIPTGNSPFFSAPDVMADARAVAAKGPRHAIEFFAKYIGEDNMIAIALWEYAYGRPALTGDVVVQPLQAQTSANSLAQYCSRRMRWLRVRKYMVLAATLVEPTTESIVCGVMGTYAISTLLWGRTFNPLFFAIHMLCWLVCDYVQYNRWAHNVTHTLPAPSWLQALLSPSRTPWQWFQVWLMRELLALPIWLAAMVGHEIEWRGKPFMIKKDLTVEEL